MGSINKLIGNVQYLMKTYVDLNFMLQLMQAEVLARSFCNLSIGSSTLTENRHEFKGGMLQNAEIRNQSHALALSEDHHQVDKELARRLHDLGSSPVSILYLGN